jgi:AcrR family transcriptional regulator
MRMSLLQAPKKLISVKPKSKPPRGDYHHGALRQALLDAAEAMLLEAGLEAFSLRECARRAGVSHGAPAHHFGDVKGLLTAFATVGFERMSLRMQRGAEAAGSDATQRLLAVGQAYIDFALDHPAHFRLMFRFDRLNGGDPALQHAGAAAAQALAWALSAALRQRGVAEDAMQDRCLLAWSAVHGLATLVLDADLHALGVDGRTSQQARAAAGRMLERLQMALLSPSSQPPQV